MSDTTTTPKGAGPKGWSDTEKLGILFQIISKMDKPIPWADIELPEGRTLKAVQVMVDKEKARAKKAKGAMANNDESEAPVTPTPGTPASKGKKRDAEAAGVDPGNSKTKNSKTPHKKRAKAGEAEDAIEGPSENHEAMKDGNDEATV